MKFLTKTIVLIAALSFSQLATASTSSIDSVIKTYISAEEKQDYERVYNLLSADMKTMLKRDIKVNNAAGYLRARLSSEAHWFNFVEKARQNSEQGVNVTYLVVIEENGESEEVSVVIKLIRQNGEWKIDAIDY